MIKLMNENYAQIFLLFWISRERFLWNQLKFFEEFSIRCWAEFWDTFAYNYCVAEDMLALKRNQGKQKGGVNRIKIDKNSDKNESRGIFRFLFFYWIGFWMKCESILKKLEEIGLLSESWVRIPEWIELGFHNLI